MVPGLSANSSSGSDSSTSRTLSRQESHCSTSSSSSSSSPTVSDTKTREREDRIESDISPVTVSTMVDERSRRPDVDQANKTPKNLKNPQKEREDPLLKERRDPLYSEIPDDEIPVHGDSHASSSHEVSLEPTSVTSDVVRYQREQSKRRGDDARRCHALSPRTCALRNLSHRRRSRKSRSF